MIRLQLATLTGKFAIASTHECADWRAVEALVNAHAQSGGYTNVKRVEDVDSCRFTAKTPGGRSGRNIAFADLEF